jgi:hypothetical protein
MQKILFLFLLTFTIGHSFASVEFMEVLENLNDEVSCIEKPSVCASSIRSVRCAFESKGREATEDGNCSYLNSRGQLVAAYDHEAFQLFQEIVLAGVEPHFNGREFKVTLKKVSCRKSSSNDSRPDKAYTCRIIE